MDYKKFLKHHWDKIILGLLISTYIGMLVTISILRHDAFASRFDLSNMDQTLWYTLHGHFFSLRLPDEFTSRFAVHADLILVLLSPMYLIWDDVRMLIASESIFLALGAIPVYLLSLRLLKNKVVSLVLASVYLLNPGMQWTDLYDFHGVSLAIPFILFAFYFAYTKRWLWYGVFAFLAILTKENISLSIAMLGLFVFFFKNRWIGFATVVIGIAWFFLMVNVVMPHFTPSGTHWALEASAEKGAGALSSIIKRNMDISTFMHTFVLNKESIDYYNLLLKPFGFLPLLGLPWLIISAPEFAINILRGTTSIVFHYDSGTVPGLVLATIFGMCYLQWVVKHIKFTKRYSKIILYGAAGVLLAIALRVNYHYSPLPTTPSCSCYIYNVTQEDRDFERVLQSLPKDAFITASLEVRPHVSHRELAFSVPSATESAQYIALITQNRIISNYEPKEYENKLIPILLSSKKHKLKFRSEHFYLFEKVNYTRPQSYP